MNSTHPTAEMNKEKPLKIGILLLVLTATSYLLEYLVNLILAQNLTPERYGDLSIALRVMTIVASLTLVGTATSAKRFLSQLLKNSDHKGAGRYIRWNVQFIALPFLVCFLLSISLAFVVTHLHITGVKHIETYHLAVLMLGLAPTLAIVLLIASYLQCSENNLAAYLPLNIVRSLLFIGLWWMLLSVFDVRPTNFLLISIVLLVILLVLTMQLAFVVLRVPSLVEAWSFRKSELEDTSARTWKKASHRMMANSVVFLIIVSLDLIVLEIVASDQAVVGYYSSALAIIAIMQRLPDGPLRPIVPQISNLIESAPGKAELQKMFNGAVRVNLITGCSAYAIIVVFGTQFLSHFGSDYVQAYPALVLLCTSALVTMLAQVAPLVLAYSGNERYLMKITLLEFFVLLSTAIPLGILQGMNGVAAATLFSVLLKAGFAIVKVRSLGLRPLGIL